MPRSIHIHIDPEGHIHICVDTERAARAPEAPVAGAPAQAHPDASAKPVSAHVPPSAPAPEPRYFEDMDPTQGWTPVLDIASTDPSVIARGHEAWLSFLALFLQDDAYKTWCVDQGIDTATLSSPTDRIALFQVFGSGSYAQALCSYVKACGGLTHAVARHLELENQQERAVEALQIAGRIVQIASVAWDTLSHYMEWPLVSATPDILTRRLARIMEV